MTDAPNENPYQSPGETARLARQDWGLIMEFVVGTVVLFLFSAPIYYYFDPLIGAAASGIAVIVATRSGIDVRRRWATDSLSSGGVLKSMAMSVFFVSAAGIGAGIACFATCFAAVRVTSDVTADYRLMALVGFGSGSIAALAVGSVLLYCLGPAKIENPPTKGSEHDG